MKTIELGIPATIKSTALGDKFHYMTGASGRRYLFSTVAVNELRDFDNAVVVLAGPCECGTRQSVWVGALENGSGIDRLRRAFRNWLKRAERAHIHLLAGTSEERRRIIDDLCAA